MRDDGPRRKLGALALYGHFRHLPQCGHNAPRMIVASARQLVSQSAGRQQVPGSCADHEGT